MAKGYRRDAKSAANIPDPISRSTRPGRIQTTIDGIRQLRARRGRFRKPLPFGPRRAMQTRAVWTRVEALAGDPVFTQRLVGRGFAV